MIYRPAATPRIDLTVSRRKVFTVKTIRVELQVYLEMQRCCEQDVFQLCSIHGQLRHLPDSQVLRRLIPIASMSVVECDSRSVSEYD